MKTYIADTNIFIRFFIKDEEKFYKKAENYLSDAKDGKIIIILPSPVIFEIDYVLMCVYKFSRQERVGALSILIKSPYLEVEERSIFSEVIELYAKKNIDLVDLYLIEKAKLRKAEVLSFDRDILKK